MIREEKSSTGDCRCVSLFGLEKEREKTHDDRVAYIHTDTRSELLPFSCGESVASIAHTLLGEEARERGESVDPARTTWAMQSIHRENANGRRSRSSFLALKNLGSALESIAKAAHSPRSSVALDVPLSALLSRT